MRLKPALRLLIKNICALLFTCPLFQISTKLYLYSETKLSDYYYFIELEKVVYSPSQLIDKISNQKLKDICMFIMHFKT